MANRTVCLCDGKYIGIESIFTVINGRQINIPEKLKELRVKSQNNELYCPCGCGANLILVAGDRNLREQHFRLKDGTFSNKCHVVTEGTASVNSKIVLKCWLDDKLQTDDVETRVPISLISNTNRKYEFSFFSRAKSVAVSYIHDRANLSNEKLNILQENSNGIGLIYIVNKTNGGCNGQYPESLMKIQDRQGYCLLIDANEPFYNDAKMFAVFYAQDNYGCWKEIRFAKGALSDFKIADNCSLQYKNEKLTDLLAEELKAFEKFKQDERVRLENEKKRREEEQKQLQKAEELRMLRAIEHQQEVEKRRKEQEAESKIRKEKEKAKEKQQFMCKHCGFIGTDDKFATYKRDTSTGTCKKCSRTLPSDQIATTPEVENNPIHTNNDDSICPKCGGELKEKNGKYGRFIGYSNYPKCRYTRSINKS